MIIRKTLCSGFQRDYTTSVSLKPCLVEDCTLVLSALFSSSSSNNTNINNTFITVITIQIQHCTNILLQFSTWCIY